MVEVAQSIERMEVINFDDSTVKPQRKMSQIDIFKTVNNVVVEDIKEKDKRAQEQQGFDIEWEKEMDTWTERKTEYKRGMIAAFAKIMNDYVTKGMHSKVTNLENCESAVKDNPVSLLQHINTLAHDGSTTTYRWKTVYKNMGTMTNANLKQGDYEHNDELVKRIEATCDVWEQQVGPYWLRGVIENDDDYKALETEREALSSDSTNDAKRTELKDKIHMLCAKQLGLK